MMHQLLLLKTDASVSIAVNLMHCFDASVSIAETGASISNLLKADESVYVTEHRFLSSCR
jgi:hypothetical protein